MRRMSLAKAGTARRGSGGNGRARAALRAAVELVWLQAERDGCAGVGARAVEDGRSSAGRAPVPALWASAARQHPGAGEARARSAAMVGQGEGAPDSQCDAAGLR